MLKFNKIYCIDALKGLKQLDDESIDCVMTSPPYWCLRDYDTPPLIWNEQRGCKHDFKPDDPRLATTRREPELWTHFSKELNRGWYLEQRNSDCTVIFVASDMLV